MVPEGWASLGLVQRTRGNKGEVVVELLTQSPDRFRELSGVSWHGSLGEARPLEIEDVWQHQNATILKFKGVDSISDAEALRGGDLCIPLSQRRPLAAGEVFLDDLVGMMLVDEQGQVIAPVRSWYEEGDQVWLELAPHGDLVPYVREFFLHIDSVAKRITTRLPEGLLEVNRDSNRP